MVVRPLAHRCLSYPTGMAFTQDQKILFVCQTGNNRLLRFYQTSQGIFYISCFFQFSGRFGPTAVSIGQGKIFVALFEFKNISSQNCICVLNMKGQLSLNLKLGIIGGQLSGLYIPLKKNIIYLTQNSGKGCFIRGLIKKSQQQEQIEFEQQQD